MAQRALAPKPVPASWFWGHGVGHAMWVMVSRSCGVGSGLVRHPEPSLSACERYHKRLAGIHLGSQSVRTVAEMATRTMTKTESQPGTKAKDTTPRATTAAHR